MPQLVLNNRLKSFGNSSNTWKVGLTVLTNDATFTMGVFAAFMLYLGLSLAQISMAFGFYLLFYSLLQIPSGFLTDSYGYKKTLLLGGTLFFIGSVLFAFADGFVMVLVAHVLLGSGSAMRSGADTALLYESMVAEGRAEKFKNTAGSIEFVVSILIALAAIVGGFLYAAHERSPFIAEVILVGLSLIGILFVKEPAIDRQRTSFKQHLISSTRQSFKTPDFSKIFLLSAVIGSVAITAFQYLQPLYLSLGIDERYFGIIAAVAYLIRGLGSLFAKKLGKLFTIDKYLVLHGAVFSLFLITVERITLMPVVLLAVASFYLLRGLYAPTVNTYINGKVATESRATMLSINSQLLTLVSAGSFLITGFLGERYGVQTAYYGLGLLSLTFLIIYVSLLRKVEAG
jgi:MFS family permease